jgi:hypothetical protein
MIAASHESFVLALFGFFSELRVRITAIHI